MNEQALLQQLHDIREYLPTPVYKQPWPYLGMIGLVIAVALLIWYLKRKKRVSPLTLQQQMELALNKLVIDEYRGAEFYQQLTALLKYYLEQRYVVPLQDKTDTELSGQFERLDLPKNVSQELAELFGRVTEIKFARRQVGKETMQQDKQRALSVIALTALEPNSK